MSKEMLQDMPENVRRKNYILSIRNLPPISDVVVRLNSLLDDPMSSTHQIGSLINQDQALTLKILTVANSPLYGLPRKVPSIDFAILVLGFDQIKQIVIALSLMDRFQNENAKFWNRKSFWIHSFITAFLAKNIAAEFGYPKTGEAFTSGLLHDLGISVIQKYFNQEFIEINELVNSDFISYREAEEKVMNISHMEISKILCDKWNLPESLSESIFYHHNPGEAANNKKLACIVHLADYATRKLELGQFLWDEYIELDEVVIKELKLGSQEYVDTIIESYLDQIKEQIELLIF